MMMESAPGGLDDFKYEHDADSTITIVSKDGEKFQIAQSVAMMSQYVKSCLEFDHETRIIPLKDIEGAVLKPIIEWMVYHSATPSREIARPLRTSNLIEIVGLWDAEFIENINLELTFKVLLAANYLNLKNLLELCCAKIASLMLGKTPKQIRATFNIKDDFTAEEENQIRQEFAEFL